MKVLSTACEGQPQGGEGGDEENRSARKVWHGDEIDGVGGMKSSQVSRPMKI